jgi:hypothetical protein
VKVLRHHIEEKPDIKIWTRKIETKPEYLPPPVQLFLLCEAALDLLAKVSLRLCIPGERPSVLCFSV